MKIRLARKARLRWDARGGEHVLLWPERGLRLNATAAAAIELCDGTRSEAEVAAALADKFAAPVDDVARDIAPLFAELRRRALIVES